MESWNGHKNSHTVVVLCVTRVSAGVGWSDRFGRHSEYTGNGWHWRSPDTQFTIHFHYSPFSTSSTLSRLLICKNYLHLSHPTASLSLILSLLLLLPPLAQTQSSEVGRLIHKITTLASTQLSSAAVAVAVVVCACAFNLRKCVWPFCTRQQQQQQ